MKPNYTKIFFGIMIFLFSTALAYFSADYFADTMNFQSIGSWAFVMFIAGLVYAVAGVLLVRVVPVSLGLLFAADVALLDALARDYDKIEGIYRVGLIGIVLVVVYLFAWYRCKDSAMGGGATGSGSAQVLSEVVVSEAPKA